MRFRAEDLRHFLLLARCGRLLSLVGLLAGCSVANGFFYGNEQFYPPHIYSHNQRYAGDAQAPDTEAHYARERDAVACNDRHHDEESFYACMRQRGWE